MLMYWCSIHFSPWEAISHPACFIALTASGFLASAVATPKTVTGIARSLNMRCKRQNPAREPYS